MHAVLPSIIMVVGQPLMVLMNPQSRTVCVAAEALVIGSPTNDIPSSENTATAMAPARADRTFICVNITPPYRDNSDLSRSSGDVSAHSANPAVLEKQLFFKRCMPRERIKFPANARDRGWVLDLDGGAARLDNEFAMRSHSL